jgi:hypothetical protein
MINKEMNDKSEQIEEKAPVNELGGLYFSTMIKIFDPETEEILVQQRGDN